MRILTLPIALVCIVAFVGAGQAQEQSQGPESIVLQLPYGIETAGIEILFMGYPPLGDPALPPVGYGSTVRVRPGVWEYEIPTRGRDGQRLATLKVAIGSMDYQTEILDLTSMLTVAQPIVHVPVPLQPIGTVPIRGRIELEAGLTLSDVEVRIDFLPDWQCEFLDRIDCMYVVWPVATAPIAIDGTFSATVPDFFTDALGSFSSPGRLLVRIQDRETDEPVSFLTPRGEFGITISDSYPDVIVLDSERVEPRD